jgi:DNA-binding beta-propeller fold protein YncE
MNFFLKCRKSVKTVPGLAQFRLLMQKGQMIFSGTFLILGVLMVPPAFAINIVNIEFLFNISNDFKEPSDVAVSKTGLIYVVDGVNNKIKIFKPNGEALSSFGEDGTGKGQFRFPLGIDVDREGNIYIADSGNHRVQIFNQEAVFKSKIELPEKDGKPADPTDVAVDSTRKRLYVVDNDNHRVLFYDLKSMKLVKTVGEPGEQDLMFRYPFFIALNKENYLHIVDLINTRVQVVNPDGLFVTNIGRWGVDKGQFFRPKGVAVDVNDRVYVSDSYMGVIQVFDKWGEFYGVVGDVGKDSIHKFRTPMGLFIDDHNRLYVVEMLAEKVSVFSIKNEGK